MSEVINDYKIQDLITPTSEEWIESVAGDIQVVEEQAKVANKGGFIKFSKDERKLIHVPEKDEKGEINKGKIKYKAFVKNDDGVKLIFKDTEEEVKEDPLYIAAKEKPIIQERHLVYVLEITKGGVIPWTWDLAKTHWKELFKDYLAGTRNVFVRKDDKKFVIVPATDSQVKAAFI